MNNNNILRIYVNTDDQKLIERYKIAAKNHNNHSHGDSGFDVFMPNSIEINKQYGYMVDTKIICEMSNTARYQSNDVVWLEKITRGFYLYPRSSLSKTSLRLSNSVGIIDPGYRGNIKCAFDAFKDTKIDKYDRLVQICHPSLDHFEVVVVDTKFKETERGDGSSGK